MGNRVSDKNKIETPDKNVQMNDLSKNYIIWHRNDNTLYVNEILFNYLKNYDDIWFTDNSGKITLRAQDQGAALIPMYDNQISIVIDKSFCGKFGQLNKMVGGSIFIKKYEDIFQAFSDLLQKYISDLKLNQTIERTSSFSSREKIYINLEK